MVAPLTRPLRVAERKVGPPRFRQVTRAHVALAQEPAFASELATALPSVCGALAALIGGEVAATARLLETEAPPARSFSAFSSFALFELGRGCARVALEVERSFLCSALGSLSGESQPPGPATRLTRIEEAAFGFVCLCVLSALRANEPVESHFAPRLLATTDERREALARMDARVPHVAVELRLEVGALSGLARLFVPAAAVQRALGGCRRGAPGGGVREVLAAAVPVTAVVGHTRLTVQEWTEAEVGDVVVLEGPRRVDGAIEGPCVLRNHAFALEGALGTHQFTFLGAKECALTREYGMAEGPPSDRTVVAVPLEVEVELTRLRISLAELSSLRPGTIVPLRVDATEPVLLRVGDRVVARAELVELGAELGARILSFVAGRES